MKKTEFIRSSLWRTMAAMVICFSMAATGTLLPLSAAQAADASSTAAKQLVIGSMIWNTSVPFYSNFIKGQQQTAARLGAKLVIVDGRGELGTEISGVQQLIAQRVDVLLITASDPKGIAPVIRRAEKAGIPVFAFNFNNFGNIYLLTGGGPAMPNTNTPAGSTDILISYTYKLAFEGGRGQDFGFASAISIIIFFIVGGLSFINFRLSGSFEEVNR